MTKIQIFINWPEMQSATKKISQHVLQATEKSLDASHDTVCAILRTENEEKDVSWTIKKVKKMAFSPYFFESKAWCAVNSLEKIQKIFFFEV